MSAIFDFSSLLTVLLLLICTCSYIRELRPTIFDGGLVATKPGKEGDGGAIAPATIDPHTGRLKREGLMGFLWKLSRIGERLSPYVGAGCFIMAIHVLFFKKG